MHANFRPNFFEENKGGACHLDASLRPSELLWSGRHGSGSRHRERRCLSENNGSLAALHSWRDLMKIRRHSSLHR